MSALDLLGVAAVYGGAGGTGFNPPVFLGFGIALLVLGVISLLVAAITGSRMRDRLRLMFWILGAVWGGIGAVMTIVGVILI